MIQSAVSTKQSILLSEVADIQIGIELQTIIQALTDYNFVSVHIKSRDTHCELAFVIQMSACIEEHFKKHHRDHEVISLLVDGRKTYFDWV